MILVRETLGSVRWQHSSDAGAMFMCALHQSICFTFSANCGPAPIARSAKGFISQLLGCWRVIPLPMHDGLGPCLML
jgi:hypothetical protein